MKTDESLSVDMRKNKSEACKLDEHEQVEEIQEENVVDLNIGK